MGKDEKRRKIKKNCNFALDSIRLFQISGSVTIYIFLCSVIQINKFNITLLKPISTCKITVNGSSRQWLDLSAGLVDLGRIFGCRYGWQTSLFSTHTRTPHPVEMLVLVVSVVAADTPCKSDVTHAQFPITRVLGIACKRIGYKTGSISWQRQLYCHLHHSLARGIVISIAIIIPFLYYFATVTSSSSSIIIITYSSSTTTTTTTTITTTTTSTRTVAGFVHDHR